MSSNRRISFTERHTPGDLSFIKVDRNELRVWRLGNWNCTQRACGSLDYPGAVVMVFRIDARITPVVLADLIEDRKSTRLNSSHSQISYAVFCLKKKKNIL